MAPQTADGMGIGCAFSSELLSRSVSATTGSCTTTNWPTVLAPCADATRKSRTPGIASASARKRTVSDSTADRRCWRVARAVADFFDVDAFWTVSDFCAAVDLSTVLFAVVDCLEAAATLLSAAPGFFTSEALLTVADPFVDGVACAMAAAGFGDESF